MFFKCNEMNQKKNSIEKCKSYLQRRKKKHKQQNEYIVSTNSIKCGKMI